MPWVCSWAYVWLRLVLLLCYCPAGFCNEIRTKSVLATMSTDVFNFTQTLAELRSHKLLFSMSPLRQAEAAVWSMITRIALLSARTEFSSLQPVMWRHLFRGVNIIFNYSVVSDGALAPVFRLQSCCKVYTSLHVYTWSEVSRLFELSSEFEFWRSFSSNVKVNPVFSWKFSVIFPGANLVLRRASKLPGLNLASHLASCIYNCDNRKNLLLICPSVADGTSACCDRVGRSLLPQKRLVTWVSFC